MLLVTPQLGQRSCKRGNAGFCGSDGDLEAPPRLHKTQHNHFLNVYTPPPYSDTISAPSKGCSFFTWVTSLLDYMHGETTRYLLVLC